MRILLLLLIAVAYANSFRAAFLLNDKYTIPLNEYLNGANPVVRPFVAPPGRPPPATRSACPGGTGGCRARDGATTWPTCHPHGRGAGHSTGPPPARPLAPVDRDGRPPRLLVTLLWAVHPTTSSP
ncbi:MAG: hypothetical protein U1F87_09185 [Kiritimatiellia bacterium]